MVHNSAHASRHCNHQNMPKKNVDTTNESCHIWHGIQSYIVEPEFAVDKASVGEGGCLRGIEDTGPWNTPLGVGTRTRASILPIEDSPVKSQSKDPTAKSVACFSHMYRD